MSVAIPDSPDSGKSQTNQFRLLSSAEITSSWVNTILGIINTLNPQVTEYDESDPLGTVQQVNKKYDGGVRMAAEHTLITAFDRLDKMLQEDALWHSPSVDRMLADKVEEVNAINVQVYTEKLRAEREANRPYRKYGAKLGLLQNNSFIAYIGVVTDPLCIAAQGNSAEEALLNLDNILIARESGTPHKKDSIS